MAITTTTTLSEQNSFTGLATIIDTASLAGGGAVALGTQGAGGPRLEFYNATGSLVRSIEAPYNGTPQTITVLSDNTLLMTFATGDGSYAVRLSATGVPLGDPFSLSFAPTDVVAMAGGTFAVLGGTGTPVVTLYSLFDTSAADDMTLSLLGGGSGQVVGTKLDNGNLALAWTTVSGPETEIWTAVMRPDGTYVKSPSVFDTVGSVNNNPSIVSTPTGFVIAYADNGWTGTNNDITIAYLDTSGTFVGFQHLTSTTTNDAAPSLSRLSDGIAVAWTDTSFAPDNDIIGAIIANSDAAYTAPTARAMDGSSSYFDNTVDAQVVTVSSDMFLVFSNDVTTGKAGVSRGYSASSVSGDGANDTYLATAKAELVNLGFGTDTVSYANSTAAVYVKLGGSVSRGGFAERDTVVADNLIGSAFGDRLQASSASSGLTGGAGNDTLIGSGGVDTIIGGAGRDFMRGGVDQDTFVFNAVADSAKGALRDVIADFAVGIDLVRVSTIDANTALAGNQTFGFTATTAVANAVWYKVSGSDVIVNGDVNGDKIADFEFLIKGVAVLNAGDFIL